MAILRLFQGTETLRGDSMKHVVVHADRFYRSKSFPGVYCEKVHAKDSAGAA